MSSKAHSLPDTFKSLSLALDMWTGIPENRHAMDSQP